ncbi:MAG: molybdopterin-containing oxidoreductase family protein [Coriobacteriales bacterium]|jgi:anaerobic selenocysteine-containing dehydrogenase
MKPGQKAVRTICQGWGCHDHCVLTTIVNEDGKIDHMEPLQLPDHIKNDPTMPPHGGLNERCVICAKGAATAKSPYMDERIKYPMKRAGKRGEGKWERISWDQALDEIAEKLNDIRAKYGNESVMINNFPCGMPAWDTSMTCMMMYRFMEATGASNLEWEGIDLSPIIGPSMWNNDMEMVFYSNPDRMADADYIVIWSGNPTGATRSGYTTKLMADKKDAGVKIVDIGIVFDAAAANANQFIGIKPATDSAFAFAVAKIIFDTKRYDAEFLCGQTDAPFLVRKDNGQFLRERDIVGGDSDSYVVWDKNTNGPICIPKGYRAAEGFDADLFASVTVAGIECETVLSKLRRRVSPYTPEFQETITGVPAQTVRTFTEEYLAHENAFIWMGAGLRYKNSVSEARAVQMLPLLTGKVFSKAGGIIFEPNAQSFPLGLNAHDVEFGGLPEGTNTPTVTFQTVLDSFKDPTAKQYKALIVTYSNPVHNWTPRKLWTEEVVPNLDLLVVFEIRQTETTDLADYVLPDTTVFEREEIANVGHCLVHCPPAIEPLYEVRNQAQVYIDLGKRMGLEKYFDKTLDEYFDIWLDCDDPYVNTVEPKVTLERLRKEGIIKMNTPSRPFDIFTDNSPLTESGRINFYLEDMVGIPGGPIVDRTSALIDDDARRKKYPLHLFIGRSRFFMQGQLREIEELDKLSGDGPRLGMNREEAVARGLKEGDMVEIFNEKGVVKVPLVIVNFLQPGMVHLWYAYGKRWYDEFDSEPAQAIASYVSCHEAVDEICVKWVPKMFKLYHDLGLPDGMINTCGISGTETIWDVLCDVRRAE